ncbi:MAG: tetratricopeptide repeat protein [Vicinamibacteria bacterium]
MTRFRFYSVPLAASVLLFGTSVRAHPASPYANDDARDEAKLAKKEVAFGIDVARRGLWQEARFRFQQASTMNPDSASAFNNLGVTLEQQGEFDKARTAYERALQLEPKNLSIQQNYDLFREADEKRNKKTKKDAAAAKPKDSPSAPGSQNPSEPLAKPVSPLPGASPVPTPLASDGRTHS